MAGWGWYSRSGPAKGVHYSATDALVQPTLSCSGGIYLTDYSSMKRSLTRSVAGRGPFVLGLDFGTLSGRALLVDARDGSEVATAVMDYPHGVVEQQLPDSSKTLPPDTALQDPDDYLQVLDVTIPKVLRSAKVSAEQVVAIGTDFTCCTMMPVLADGTPLCRTARWRRHPHAWVKLWKHHAAQPEADEINALGQRRGELFMKTYGGKYSSEWFFSKMLETVRYAPQVYRSADRFVEAGDWIVWQLTGQLSPSLSAAGFKAMRVYAKSKSIARARDWSFPANDFFNSLNPLMNAVVEDKLSRDFHPVGGCAGGLSASLARRWGLLSGTPVAVGNIDAHAAVPACTVTEPGRLVMIMGTSTCHICLSNTRREVEGMCGVVRDGVIPGLWGYEAGQAGVGDVFAWFVEQAVSADVMRAAKRQGQDLHAHLAGLAERLQPGQSGLLALDWWNGNRSVLVDADLTGLLVGASLATRPHEIYRALIEATAFGTRKIIEAFSSQGVAIDELVACGGLANKNSFLMQVYADVTGRPIRVAASEQTSALGAAMLAAVAAGVYDDIHAAARRMARLQRRSYRPRSRNFEIYNRLYREYTRLHDWFGRESDSPMKVLKQIRSETWKRP